MRSATSWAAERLGYRFADPALLEAALTHPSAGRRNFERLEFLGDSVLNFVVAELAYRRFPTAAEGELSRYRAALVSRTTLAAVAGELAIGEQVRLGSGELKTGGFRRESILADALEAVLGAVYLDGGLQSAQEVIQRLVAERLGELPPAGELKDAKTRLQELLQARGEPLPAYAVEEVGGEPHEHWFVASCTVVALGLTERGEGTSRRKAEQQAAQRTIDAMMKAGVA